MEKLNVLVISPRMEDNTDVNVVKQFIFTFILCSIFPSEILSTTPRSKLTKSKSSNILLPYELKGDLPLNIQNEKNVNTEKTYILLAERSPTEIIFWNCKDIDDNCGNRKQIISKMKVLIYLFERSNPQSLKDILDRKPEINHLAKSGGYEPLILFVGYSFLDDNNDNDDVVEILQNPFPDLQNKYYDITFSHHCDHLSHLLNNVYNTIDKSTDEIDHLLKISGINEIYHSIIDQFCGIKRLKKVSSVKKVKPIPTLIIETLNYLETYALSTNGIFCNDNEIEANKLYDEYKKCGVTGKPDLSKLPNNHNSHYVVATILKNFLRDCSDPLLPPDFIPLSTYEELEDKRRYKKRWIEYYITSLPVEIAYILDRLLFILSKVVSNKHRTLVESKLLSSVISPYLLGIRNVQQKVYRSIELLINDYEQNRCRRVDDNHMLQLDMLNSKKTYKTWLRKKTLNLEHHHHHHQHNVEIPDFNIHTLAENGKFDLLQIELQNRPWLIDSLDRDGNTLLHSALNGISPAAKGYPMYSVAKFIVDQNPQQCIARNNEKKTPIHKAIDMGSNAYDLLFLFLENTTGSGIESLFDAINNGKNILHYAARIDCPQLLQYLQMNHPSSYRSSLYYQDLEGCTPLHYAARNHPYRRGDPNNFINLRFLIQQLSDHNRSDNHDHYQYYPSELRDSTGKTPLHHAISEMHDDFAYQMVDHLVPPGGNGYTTLLAADNAGQLPLHIAVIHNKLQTSETLIDLANRTLQAYALVSSRDCKGKIPLHYASKENNVEMVIMLTNNNDIQLINIKDYLGKSPLHYAVEGPHTVDVDNQLEVLKLLIKRGANVNCVDFTGRSPLHYASTLEALKCLIENGAEVYLDINGESPLQYTISRCAPHLLIQSYQSLFSSINDNNSQKNNNNFHKNNNNNNNNNDNNNNNNNDNFLILD